MGIVNIFLGGSGKYIAEELKGTATYYNIEMPDLLAFDLDTAASHTGTFTLDVGTELLTVDPTFPTYAQQTVATTWSALDAGRHLGPAPGQAGPQRRPEVSVMRRVGVNVKTQEAPTKGLWGMRGSGLLAFSAFMDPSAPGQAGALRARFEQQVQHALQNAAYHGGDIWVNLVASTAGGTGAGTFLPIALWLRQFAAPKANIPDLKISLVLFWWTTFDNEAVGGKEQVELLSKGQSGSYAILRELQLLNFDQDLHDAVDFPERRFPLWPETFAPYLSYRLNGKPFDRIYWLGRRADAPTSSKVDVYDEGSRLLQILSHPGVVGQLAGATGPFAQRIVASVTSVDYPRLRVAQRLSGELVEEAIGRLLGSPDDPGGDDHLSDQGQMQPNALEAFIRNEQHGALAPAIGGNANASPSNLDTMIQSVLPAQGLELAVARGPARKAGGYSNIGPEWQNYCVSLKHDLDRQNDVRRQQAKDSAASLAVSSIDRFREWLSERVVAPKLDPPAEDQPPASLASVRQAIGAVSQEVAAVETFFSAPGGVQARVPHDAGSHYRPVGDIDADITTQYERLLNPPREGRGGLVPLSWVLVVLAMVGAGALAQYLLSSLTDGGNLWLWTIAAAIAAGALAFRLLQRRTSLEERKKEEEDRLFARYRDREYRQAADALFEAVRSTFVPSVKGEIDEITGQIDRLQKVYAELRGRAHTRRTQANRPPLHSVGQVGNDITIPPFRRGPSVAALVRAVRVQPELGANRHGLRLRIREVAPVRGCSALVGPLADFVASQGSGALGQLPGQQEFETVDKTLDDLGTTVLRDILPQTFEDAITRDGANNEAKRVARMTDLLRKLMHQDDQGRFLASPDRRQPSLLLPQVGEPAFRLLLVPNPAVGGLVTAALNALGNDSTAQELRKYLPPGGYAVLPTIGPSVATLTVWQATDLFRLPDSVAARQAYYGLDVAPGANGAAAWHRNQSQWNFQLLPEAAAAAAIELQDNPVRPLHPGVVARLLGSDPASGGPTLFELFYLLRLHERLAFGFDGDGANRRRVTRLNLPGFDPVSLHAEPAVAPINPNDPFGKGRFVVNGYDAFCDFMLFDGARMGPVQAGDHRFVGLPFGAQLEVGAWSQLGPARLGELQHAIVELWYAEGSRADAEAESRELIRLAQADAALFGGGALNGADGLPGDWVRAITVLVQTGCQKRLSHQEMVPGRRG